jgi:hypothetical protein
MRFVIKLLIFLIVASSVWAQVWPGDALCGPESGAPSAPAGEFSLSAIGGVLHGGHWRDSRMRLYADLGLGRGLGISLATSMRDLHGFGAFVKGMEDTRLGMSFWPEYSPTLRFGLNGFLTVPTGYRKQEWYYDGEADTNLLLPSLSLKQTGGEIYTGVAWNVAPAADLNLFGGYFSSSDRTEQAFRWGIGAQIAPFGKRCWGELNFSQSITRIGLLPTTQTLEATVPFSAGSGIIAAPGLWADLDDEPTYGLSLGLRFNAIVPGLAVPKPPRVIVTPPKIAGVVLVAPPQSDVTLADEKELWQSIQDGVSGSFDMMKPVSSLDLPGLPFDYRADEPPAGSIQALALAHPEADWLLISRVVREDISKQRGLFVPLVVSQPSWSAQCKLKVQLVDLRGERVSCTQIVEGRAEKKDDPQLAMLSSGDTSYLNQSAGHALTLEAYKNAGREIARELVTGR